MSKAKSRRKPDDKPKKGGQGKKAGNSTRSRPSAPRTAGNDEEGKIHVFVSHRHEHEQMARDICKAIFGRDGRFEARFSEDTTRGDNWRGALQKALSECRIFLLLFGDPAESWDWCLFEAGIYDASANQKDRKLVYFHRPGAPRPKPLADRQSVEVDAVGIYRFLVQLYGTDKLCGRVLHKDFAADKDDVMKVAKEVCEKFHRYHPVPQGNRRIRLLISDDTDLSDGVPPDTEVRCGDLDLSLFGMAPKELGGVWTWGELARDLPPDMFQALSRDLGSAIDTWRGNREVPRIRATFFSTSRPDREYGCLLDRRRALPDGITDYEVILVPEQQVPHPEWPLLDVLPMANNILVKLSVYLARVDAWKANRDQRTEDSVCESVGRLVEDVVREASEQDVLSPAKMLKEFRSSEDLEEVHRLYDEWPALHASLVDAVVAKDIAKLEPVIKKWKSICQAWAKVALRRLGEVAATA